jgi:hypothetical protein
MVGALKQFARTSQTDMTSPNSTLMNLHQAQRPSVESSGKRVESRQCGAGLPFATASHACRRHS